MLLCVGCGVAFVCCVCSLFVFMRWCVLLLVVVKYHDCCSYNVYIVVAICWYCWLLLLFVVRLIGCAWFVDLCLLCVVC